VVTGSPTESGPTRGERFHIPMLPHLFASRRGCSTAWTSLGNNVVYCNTVVVSVLLCSAALEIRGRCAFGVQLGLDFDGTKGESTVVAMETFNSAKKGRGHRHQGATPSPPSPLQVYHAQPPLPLQVYHAQPPLSPPSVPRPAPPSPSKCTTPSPPLPPPSVPRPAPPPPSKCTTPSPLIPSSTAPTLTGDVTDCH